MNEKEVERLLKAYGDSVPPCVVPALQRKPLRWPRFAAVGIATAAVAGIAVVGLWPRDAVAGSVARLHRALSNAKTMEYTLSIKIPSRWEPVVRAYYEDGAWRYDTRLGTNLEYTAVRRDGMELIDYKSLDHASLDLARPDEESEKWQTALDFAKKGIDSGNADIQRSLTILDHPPVDGRPAYEIRMSGPTRHYLAKILVDKETDLPIESSVIEDDVRPGFGDVPQQIRTEFQFNKPLDPQTFSLDPKNRVVIRMGDARDQLKKMWLTPIGSVAGAEERAATMTRDGTIWIATTSDGDHPVLPMSIRDSSGRQYVRGGDASPGSQFSNKAIDEIFGKPIYVTAFAPLLGSDPSLAGANGGSRSPRAVPVWDGKRYMISITRPGDAETSSSWSPAGQHSDIVTLQFGPRDPSFVGPGRLLVAEAGATELVTVPVTHERGNLPSYFPMLGLDLPNALLTQSIWRAKAQELEANQQYQLAAEAYGELAKARYDWVKYSAFQPMLDEARCYRLIGQSEKAEQLTQAAAVLKASRER